MAEQTEQAERSVGRNPRRLWVHYVLSLSILVGLLSANHVFQINLIKEQVIRLEQVEISGQQRMLSQRIAYFATTYDQSGSDEAAKALEAAVIRFRANNAVLGDLARNSESLSLIYFDPNGDAVDALSRNYADLADQFLAAPPGSAEARAALALLKRQGPTLLLERLDSAVRAFVQEQNPAGGSYAYHQKISFLGLVSVILLIGVAVFLPAHRAVIRSLASLEESNEEINRKNESLRDYSRRLILGALRDPLTGLDNRRSLNEKLTALLEWDGLGANKICAIHLDLDGFKQLNDRMGHAAGDAALKQVSQIMKESVRGGDLVARFGGDEFVIVAVLDGPDFNRQAQGICNKLIERISRPMVLDGADVQIGASLGYAFAPDTAQDAATLIANADVALYEAKRAGKGIARPFAGALKASLDRRNAVIKDLEAGLLEGQFLPFFQPIVSADTGAVLGLEMLMRWDHPSKGLLSPSSFIDIAEEAGLVDAIDARVQLDGLDAIATLRREGWSVPRLSLNASLRTIRFNDYVERLIDALDVHGFVPADIVVEVKETSLIAEQSDQAVRTISELRTAGFSVFVDNFGTGYSSLSTLSRLDVNGLKIDQALVADIDAPKVRQIAGAVIGLARAMSMSVVAEGVETAAQFKHLKSMGVDAVQGFELAEPMSLENAKSWLESYGKTTRIAG